MKKVLTIALVLVMALGLAAPAMAYTTRQALASGVSPYVVDIYLVEHSTADRLSVNWLGLPPTDRGYAKNEIVATIGTVTIPNGYNLHEDGYRAVYFKGANVVLNVTDNRKTLALGGVNVTDYFLDMANVPSQFYGRVDAAYFPWDLDSDDTRLRHWLSEGSVGPALGGVITAPATAGTARVGTVAADSEIPTASGKTTAKFLCFGKVTADDAKMTFGVSRRAGWVDSTASANMEADLHWGVDPFALGIVPAPALWLSTAEYGNTLPNSTGILSTSPAFDSILVLSEDLVVSRVNSGNAVANIYFVFENPDGYAFPSATGGFGGVAGEAGELKFIVETGNRGVSQRLYMFPNGAGGVGYHVFVEPSTNELVFAITDLGNGTLPANRQVGDDIRIGTSGYTSLRAFYDEWFEGNLGFTAFNRGNLLIGDDWTDLAASAWDVKETVDIEPWTPYVSVPDNIVTDPPKTGDASFLGFVMIALAGAAAVVVKKVHA